MSNASPEAAADEAASHLSTGGTHDMIKQLGILDMPGEILVEIMCNLSPETLPQCMLAHPVFMKLTQGNHFKSKYIRTQLRLPNDQDVKHDIPLDSFSPIVELWYSTNATLAERRARRVGLHKPLLKTSFKFFHLAIFKHLFQTWFVQAGCLSLAKPDKLNSKKEGETSSPLTSESDGDNNTQDVIPPKNSVKTCHRLFDGYSADMPNFVTAFLTRLFLAAPHFLERSLYMRHLHLHIGHPVILAHSEILDEFRSRKYPASLKPHFSLEMISSEAHEDDSYSAILILITTDTCVLWIGTVSEFPGSAHMSTSALRIIDTKISFSSLKQLVGELFGAFEKGLNAKQVDHKFLMKQLFPGACNMVHRKMRADLIDRLDTGIDNLARKMHAQLAHVTFQSDSTKTQVPLPDKLSRIMSTFGVDVSTYTTASNPGKKHWRPVNLFKPYQFVAALLYCEACVKISNNIRRRLLMISANEFQYFWKHQNSHLTTCEDCLKKYDFRVGGFIMVEPSPNENVSAEVPKQDSWPAYLTFENSPYHLISRSLEMTKSALELLDEPDKVGDCLEYVD